jgi:DNA-binding NarL/FixJ family response regulator
MIRILIVDDQKTIHKTLESYLETEPEIEIVGFAYNGQEAIQQVEELKPDLALMDIEMPIINGLEATKIICESFVSTKVLMFTNFDDEQNFQSALQMGVKGYLLKTTPAREIISAIRYAHMGYFQLGPDLIEKYISKIPRLKTELSEIGQLKNMLESQVETVEKLKKEIKIISDKDKEERFSMAQNTNTQIKLDIISQQMRKLQKQTIFLYKLLIVSICLIVLAIAGTIHIYTQILQ